MKAMTLQDLSDKLDRIAEFALIGSKSVLSMDEAALFTGMSKGYLYRLTSQRRIPHFKKSRKLYFKKSELEEWMLDSKVLTDEEIRDWASTYVSTHSKKERPNLLEGK